MSRLEDGATVVLKVGGSAAGPEGLGALGREIAARLGRTRFVVVHGGGKQVTEVSRRLGHEPVIRGGVRQTSAAEMEVVDMVLAGSVSTATVRALCAQGVRAVGLNGADAGLLRARPVATDTRTGCVETVDPSLILTLLSSGYTPVVSSVAADSSGNGLNINADDVAFALAQALKCDVLVFFSDVPGVMKDGKVLPTIDAALAAKEMERGAINGGMLPKVKASLDAVGRGIGRVVIADYRGEGDLERTIRGERGTTVLDGGPGREPESRRLVRDPPIARCFPRELLVLDRGEGVWLRDVDGRRYLDFAGGIGVNALGYGRSDLADVAAAQMRKLVHVSNLFATEPALALAAELVKTGPFAAVQFQNSGSEANEAAIKFARMYSLRRKGAGHHRLLSFTGSFHGRTMGALSLTPTPKYQEPFGPLVPGVHVSGYNDVDALHALLDPTFAGVIVEVVQGEGGLESMTPVFAQALNELCRKHDIMLIADEVQTGLCRTGSLYASRLVGLEPDMITLAKPLAAGLPLSAVLIPPKVNDLLHEGEHGGTFPGGPVTTAVALKVWETLGREDFVQGVRARGETLCRMLEDLAKRQPALGRIKGMGLLRGVELNAKTLKVPVDGQTPTLGVVTAAREAGLLILRSGSNVLRLAPPLVVSQEELGLGVDMLERVLMETI